jgi:ABC-2 type transport system permease protein
MTSIRIGIRAYPALLKAYWIRALEYRGVILIWILSGILPLVMMMVWLTVSVAGPVAGYDSTAFVSYYLMVILVRRLTGVWIIWDLDREIRLGELSFYLLKPFHPIHHHLARVVASKPVQLLLVGPPLLIAAVLLQAHYEQSLASIGPAIIAMIGGLLIEFFVQAIIGTTGFWITRASSLAEVWFLIRALLSGWIIPIDLFPPPVTAALQYLPFRYIMSLPIEILLGRLTPERIALGLAIQYLWVSAFGIIFFILWQRGLKRYGAIGA